MTPEARSIALRGSRCAQISLVLSASLATAGCAAWPRRWGATPCCITQKPVIHQQPIWWHLFDVTVVSQVRQGMNVVRVGRKWLGAPVRALNLDDGQLTHSLFMDARDPTMLTPSLVRWGPTQPADVSVPPYAITKAKTEGKTPGFFVTDARGRKYLFKLDPVESPDLLSGAEVVSSKLLYALGYHVPSYEIVTFAPEELQPGGNIDAEALQAILTPRARDGRIRVVASKLLDGEILGPIPFKRFRDCTEARALKLPYAWINNIDTKDHNSLLVWNGETTVGYLIDFGTSLGADAGAAGPKTPCAGWLHIVDLPEASIKLLTLGLHRHTCDPRQAPVSEGVGLFTEHVDPKAWKPYAPNLAFEEMNEQDARWMARRLAQLTRAQIDAAVAAGQYHDAADAAYLAEVLDQRRWLIVTAYLDDPDDWPRREDAAAL